MLFLLLLLFVGAGPARAAFQTFTDRAAWEAAVASAGMIVETNDFSSPPGGGFTLAGVEFSVNAGGYDAGGEFVSAPLVVRIGYTGGAPVYGLGVDHGQAVGTGSHAAVARARDTANMVGAQLGGPPDTFVGVLSDQPLDPDCFNILSCPSFGGDELYNAGQGQNTPWLDNVSVAVVAPAVPAMHPTGMLAFAVAVSISGLVAAHRRALPDSPRRRC